MTAARHALSFDVVGLPAREAILLKSFVRMLDARTHQQWLYSGNPESQAADLTFLAEDHQLADPTTASKRLRLGVPELGLFSSLSRPLRTDELESELNRLGGLLVQARTGVVVAALEVVADTLPAPLLELRSGVFSTAQQKAIHAPVLLAAAPMPTAAAQPIPIPVLPVLLTLPPLQATALELYRLLRWPHSSLLTTSGRSKLAAFMLGAPLSLQTLHMRSGQSLMACRAFVDDLNRNGFIAIVPAGATTDPLFGRLRPAANQSAQPPSSAPAGAPPKAPVLANLLGRIRKRLGIARPDQSWASTEAGQLR